MTRGLGVRFIAAVAALATIPGLAQARLSFRSGMHVSLDADPDSGPQSITLADVNGDGSPDLIVASGGAVSVHLNDGQGHFGADIGPFEADDPVAVVVADVNGDRLPDIIVANHSTGTVSVLLQGSVDGAIEFAVDDSIDDPAVDLDPVGLVIGRIDANDVPDLAVLSDSSVHLLRGSGAGRYVDFATASISLGPNINGGYAIASGDFNDDSKLDLAVTASASSRLSVFFGAGDGTFQPVKTFSTAALPRGLVVGDFGGSAFDDIAVVNGEDVDAMITLFTSDGLGSFTSENTDNSEVDSVAITAADVDGDGKEDLLVTNTSGGIGTVLFCREPSVVCFDSGLQGFQIPILPDRPDGDGFQLQSSIGAFGGDAVAVVAADVNGDGKPDVVTLSQDGSSINVALNNGAAQTRTPTATATASATPTPTGALSTMGSSHGGDGCSVQALKPGQSPSLCSIFLICFAGILKLVAARRRRR